MAANSRSGPPATSLGTQRYLANTNVLETTFRTAEGSFRVIDFAPRFFMSDRSFRPTMIVRIVEPLEGMPRVRVRCDPRLGWSKKEPARIEGSHHVSYEGFANPAPAHHRRAALLSQRAAVLAEPAAPHGAGVGPAGRGAAAAALRPLLERDGSLLAHLGQALRRPRAVPGGGHPLGAGAQAALLRGHRRDRRGDDHGDPRVAGQRPHLGLSLLLAARLVLRAERVSPARSLRGARAVQFVPARHRGRQPQPRSRAALPRRRIERSRGEHPRRLARAWAARARCALGNAAALHQQHDVFGEMVLALSPIFMDDRFSEERTRSALDLVERLARKAISVVGTPDAGIWEYRTEWKPQTFSSLMCWAAADRMAVVAARHRPELRAEFAAAAEKIRGEIVDQRLELEAQDVRGVIRRRVAGRVAAGDGEPALPAARRRAAARAPSTPSAARC